MKPTTRAPAWILASLLLSSAPAWAAPEVKVDRVVVTVEKRAGREWCVLDSQVSAEIPASQAALLAVIQDYPSYPKLFPRIREIGIEVDGDVLLSETVVVSALGIVNTNRFTLRLAKPASTGPLTRLAWTQEKTDGTIDSLEGFWLLEDLPSASGPLVRVTYVTKSAVPVRAIGQDVVIRMFLGAETKSVLEAVAKKALSR